MVIYAVEGWGKSSLATHMPDPIFLMTPGEDGLLTLMDSGLVKETSYFSDEATSFGELILGVKELCVHEHNHRTLVIDTLNGAGRLCVQHVTEKSFQNSPEKFNDFGRGWKLVPSEWQKFLDALSAVGEKGMSTVLLAHADIRTFKNPEGADYDRYVPRLPSQLWETTQEWADIILFGQLETFVKTTDSKPGAKGKASSAADGQTRLLYCERTATADAKNRHGLPAVIDCGVGSSAAWSALAGALAAGKKTASQPEKEEAA